jgi:hypothetical protein
MKKFKVVFIKVEKVVTAKTGPVQFAEQEITTDDEKLTVVPPIGYIIMSVTEILDHKYISIHQKVN